MKTQMKHLTVAMTASLLLAGCTTSSSRHASQESEHTTAGSAPHTYDLTADWSNTRNPNGVWSYDHNDSPITKFQTFWWGQAGWGYMRLGDGCIIKGSYPEGKSDPWDKPLRPAHDWRPGDVMLHALSVPYGGNAYFVNVRWTSPADGTINIRGRAWDGEIFPDRDVGWSLIVGGKTVAQRSSVRGIYRRDKSAQFRANRTANQSLSKIPITEGEVVEFRVATATYYGHFVGVEERIKFKPKAR